MRFVTLAELVQPVQTCQPAAAFSGCFPYIDIAAIDRDAKRIANAQSLSVEDPPSRARQLVRRGDVLVSTVRPNLNAVALVDSHAKAIASTGFTVLRPRTQVLDSSYLFRWVQTSAFINEMVRKATGASYPAVSDAIVKGSKIPLPPLDEQKRIAAILDKADAIRRKREQTIKLVDEFLLSLFLDAFGDPVTNSKHLAVHPLGRYLTFLTSGSRGWARYYSNSGPQFIRSLDVQMNNLCVDNCAYVQPPTGAETERTQIQPGDVLLTITGSRIGRVAAVPSTFGPAYASQHVAILRLADDLLPEYLAIFLSLDRGGQMQIARNQYGQTKPGLNLQQIREFKIPVPPLSEQLRFIAALKRAEKIKVKVAMHQRMVDLLLRTLQESMFKE